MALELGKRTRGSRRPAIAIALLAVAVASSCGKATPDIKGKLPVFPATGTLLMDGKPLPQATLTFHPLGERPNDASKLLPKGSTDENGNFTVCTYADKDGAPAGDYKVTVSWRGAEPNLRNEEEPELAPMSDRDPRTTRLKARILEGQNDLPTWDIGTAQQHASASVH